MALVTTEGIVLKVHALGDTSRIVTVYTRDLGLRKFVAKGARKTPSRFGFALEPLSRSRFVFYMKPDRDLHFLSQAEVLDPAGSRLTDLARLAHAQAALELVDRVVWGEEPHEALFTLLRQTIESCGVAPPAALPAVTLAFQLQVASELGYRPRLDACAVDGRPVSQRRAFSPARGGLLCETCATREGGMVWLSAEALAGLALLLSRPVGDAGEYVVVEHGGELLRVVEDFLRSHFQRFQGLRSLEVLRSRGGRREAAGRRQARGVGRRTGGPPARRDTFRRSPHPPHSPRPEPAAAMPSAATPKTLQQMVLGLETFWAERGCVIQQPYPSEVGAGTFNPATFLRSLGPEPWRVAYVEPSRRPKDGRYGENPNRFQQFYQYQVLLKPSPADVVDAYFESLRGDGHRSRRARPAPVEDDWESPTLGAAGLGWQVWMDGTEISQFTYFQQCGGIELP